MISYLLIVQKSVCFKLFLLFGARVQLCPDVQEVLVHLLMTPRAARPGRPHGGLGCRRRRRLPSWRRPLRGRRRRRRRRRSVCGKRVTHESPPPLLLIASMSEAEFLTKFLLIFFPEKLTF